MVPVSRSEPPIPSMRVGALLLVAGSCAAFFWNKKESKSSRAVELFASGSHSEGIETLLTPDDCSAPFIELICRKFYGADIVDSNPALCEGISVFDETGLTISSCDQIKDDRRKLFVVAKGKLFVFPTVAIGHKVTLDHVKSNLGAITLETMSHSPRVFRVYNFFTEKEADALIANALQIKEEDYRLKRSTTGQENQIRIDMSRTSDTAFDPFSETAMVLKQRCFELLGIRPYNNEWADGLQILRYNVTGGYNSHMDYISGVDGRHHNYDAEHGGSNRFATVFLYLSNRTDNHTLAYRFITMIGDVEDGGETVFPQGEPVEPVDPDFNVTPIDPSSLVLSC